MSINRGDFLIQYGVCRFVFVFFLRISSFHAVTHDLELRLLVFQSPALCYQAWFCY